MYIPIFTDHVNGRMESTDLISAMSVLDPCLPGIEKKLTESAYGMEKINTFLWVCSENYKQNIFYTLHRP